MTGPREVRTEAGEFHPQWFKKTVIEAFKNDPIRIIIEIFKNSADSYTRLQKKENHPLRFLLRFYVEKEALLQLRS